MISQVMEEPFSSKGRIAIRLIVSHVSSPMKRFEKQSALWREQQDSKVTILSHLRRSPRIPPGIPLSLPRPLLCRRS